MSEELDADGFRVEERAKTEEYHRTKNVVEADDRTTTEIHVRDAKIVRLEELMSRDTVRLATADEIRALVEAEFDGLAELDAGTEVTVEEFTRTETTRARTVAGGRPVVEATVVTEELKSDAVREDPEWKKKSSLMSHSDSETSNDVSFSFMTEDVVLRGGVPGVEVPHVVSIAPDTAPHSAEMDVSMPEHEDLSSAESASSSPQAKTPGIPGNSAKGKTKNKRSSVEAGVELDDDGIDNGTRRHEVRHKRHIIEEVIIEDSDKFYENQVRPRLFVKGRKTPTRSTHEEVPAAVDPKRDGSKTLPGGSLPNIATETQSAGHSEERSITGSVHLDGDERKPKWYSFPRKHAAARQAVPDDDIPRSGGKQKAKSQEEIVVFGGQEVEEPDSQNGKLDMKFEKWPKKPTTREMTYVVESNPTPGSSGESVQETTSFPRIGKKKKKTAEAEETGAEEFETTVTYVVERDLPKLEATERIEDGGESSLNRKGKLGGLFSVKSQNKTTSPDQPETSKPEEEEKPVEEKWSGSWSLPGKSRHQEQAHHLESQTLTFIVEHEAKPGASGKKNQEDDGEDLSTEEEEGKQRSRNLKLPAGEKKGETKKETRRVHQEEVVVDDVNMRPDDTSVKFKLPSFGGHRSKGDREANDGRRSEESLTVVVVKEEPPVVVAVATKVHSEQPSLAVEDQTLEEDAEVDRSGSWNPFRKSFWDKNIDESETLTFVVEHDLPKADIPLDKGQHSLVEATQKPAADVAAAVTEEKHEEQPTRPETEEPSKEHSFSLMGTLKGIFPQKSTYVVNEPSDETEIMTYVVEREIETPEARLDKKKERSSTLLGKIGATSTPEKTSSRASLEPETVAFTVERQVTPGKEPKVAVEKEGTFKSRRRQDEIVIDASHTLSDETEVKITPIKISGKKKEKQKKSSSPSPEPTVTNVSVAPVQVSVPEIEKKTDKVKLETVTFVVNQELHAPSPETKPVDAAVKEEEKPLRLPHIKLPSIFPTHRYDVEKAEAHVETVTYVVKEDVEEKPTESVKTKEASPPKDDAMTEVKSKPSKSPKAKEKSQKEIIVDDTQLYSEKSEVSTWSPFRRPAGKTASLEPQRNEGKAGGGSRQTASPVIDQVTVTYTTTTEVAAPDLDTSVDSSGKEKKWKLFGKNQPKSSPKISPSKPRTQQPQEELVTTGMRHVEKNHGFPGFQVESDRREMEVRIRVEPPAADPAINGASVEAPALPLENSQGPWLLKNESNTGLKLDTDDLRTSVHVETTRKTLVLRSVGQGEDRLEEIPNGKSQPEEIKHHSRITTPTPTTTTATTTTTTTKDSTSTGAHGHANGNAFEGSSSSSPSEDTVVLRESKPLYVGGGSMPAGPAASPPPSTHFVVVAIDFGTTFSGYAFSFSRDVNSVHVMRKWPDGDPGMVNQKTPTVLLLTPDQRFHSFGFTAKDFYHNLTPREAKQWLYFEKFKMALHYNADLSSTTQLAASNGHSVPALTVFSHALRFFRDHALREVSEQSETRILNEDVRWVITVPAIWKAQAKQFMRQAAYQAGIASEDNPDQLLVALEPEAASVYIRKQRLQQLIPESVIAERPVSETSSEPVLKDRISQVYNKRDTNRWSQAFHSDANLMSFQRTSAPLYTEAKIGEDLDITGTKYMVADCGGGTVDITVYEMSSDTGKLIELYKATGGPYGSMGVDLAFESLLVEIFGSDFIDVFKAKRPGGWVDLMMAFESRKRAAIPVNSKPLNVSLPFSFIDYHKKHRSSTVETAILRYGNKDVRWSSQGMLRLMPDAMTRLFQPTLNSIKEAIDNVLSKPDVKGVKYIFLVGGFAESPMVQVEMRQEFSDRVKILIPTEASLAILKGAVCFGNDPAVVKVRKSRMSYGLAVLNRFVRGKHPDSKLAVRDGIEWCLDVFDPLVLANQSVALGSCVTRSYTPAAGAEQKFGNMDVYCSDSDRVQFVTDPGVVSCGKLRIDLTDLDPTDVASGRRREVQAKLVFGDTEIKVVGIDVATGNVVNASIDFLNK